MPWRPRQRGKKELGAALPKLLVNFFMDADREAPPKGCGSAMLAFYWPNAPQRFFCRFPFPIKTIRAMLSFRSLSMVRRPFGIWRTRIWKMAPAEPIAAGEADGESESPGNGVATL